METTIQTPHHLLRLIAYSLNIKPEHHKIADLRNELAKNSAGHIGELSLRYHLSRIIRKNFITLHNIKLKVNDQYFEIDTLIISNQFIVIVEVKNLRGTIHFDHLFGGMLQVYDGQTTLYQDPILQVERQTHLLDIWLKQKGYNIPIESRVCFVNKNVILSRKNNEHVDQRIIYGYKLTHEYEKIYNQQKQNEIYINKEELNKDIIASIKTLEKPTLEYLDINLTDFQPGIVCPNCLKKEMKRKGRDWICANCNYKDKEVYINALKEYYLIFGSEITNEQARIWLKEDSRDYVRYILNKVAVSKYGSGRWMVYRLQFDLQTDFEYLLELNKKLYNSEGDY